MDASMIETLVSGGGTLTLAIVVWWELHQMRQSVEGMSDRMSRVLEHIRGSHGQA